MMSDITRHYAPTEINTIFARLNPTDVEQFYQSYQLWTLQQQITALQTQVATVQQQIAENNEQMQQVQPSAIALATLARLQANGVSDINLLDRMLERGEAWLDQTMERLAYCEQMDVIQNQYTYTEWCENALEGAYDWIDSIHADNSSSSPDQSTLADTPSSNADEALDEATEEILLQKLMSEEADDEASMLEITLKRSAISPHQSVETLPIAENDAPTVSTRQEYIPAEINDAPDSYHVADEQGTASEQALDTPAQEERILSEQATTPEQAEHIAVQDECIAPVQPPGSRQNGGMAKPGRKRSFLRRLFFVIFGR